jgi:solute carrier family 34 (sodium-dependent phosphate cotransporter)
MIRNRLKNENISSKGYYSALYRAGIIVASMFLFLFSIDLMGFAIVGMTGEFASQINNATSNPFVGLFIGLIATAVLQSSSTTTSIVVAAVASGAISLQNGIPIVLGANIGTTITSTIISMSYISKAKEFKRAIAAGVSHDFFNILTVLILLPLESRFRFLEKSSLFIASFLQEDHFPAAIDPSHFQFLSNFDFINEIIVSFVGPIISLILATILLFSCIKFISKWLYTILIDNAKERFENVIFKTKMRSFGWGLLITSIAQSSSLTTSLIVPLAATGKVKIKRAFQFILGANIGTTITALIAAIFQSEAAISLAIVHLLFNLIGVVIFLFIPFVSEFPIFLAKKFSVITVKSRIIGFAYILITFFLLPFTLIYISKESDKSPTTTEIQFED